MADFKAKIRPELHPAAQELVAAYKSVQGGETYPCLPEGIAAVLDLIAADAAETIGLCGSISVIELVRGKAALLRGEQP